MSALIYIYIYRGSDGCDRQLHDDVRIPENYKVAVFSVGICFMEIKIIGSQGQLCEKI